MPEPLFQLELWLSQFPNQELADQIRRIASDSYFDTPETLLWNLIVAYQKAQEIWNLNPENSIILETVSAPTVGTLTNTEQENIKTQKTTYTISFVSKIEIATTEILGWQKPKL